MPKCEFSEDEFECNLINTLTHKHGLGIPPFKPTKHLEHLLGFDFGVLTLAEPLYIGSIVLINNLPLINSFLNPISSRLPSKFASTFIQCKVPEYITQQDARTIEQWNAWQKDFYRIKIEEDQNKILAEQEKALKNYAVVCYGAPCFYKSSDSDKYYLANNYISMTHFQSAIAIRNHRHKVYTYQSPDGPGRGFSAAEEIKKYNFKKQLNQIIEKSGKGDFWQHVDDIYEVLSDTDTFRYVIKLTKSDRENAEYIISEIAKQVDSEGFQRDKLGSTLPKILSIRRVTKSILNSEWIVFTKLDYK